MVALNIDIICLSCKNSLYVVMSDKGKLKVEPCPNCLEKLEIILKKGPKEMIIQAFDYFDARNLGGPASNLKAKLKMFIETHY